MNSRVSVIAFGLTVIAFKPVCPSRSDRNGAAGEAPGGVDAEVTAAIAVRTKAAMSSVTMSRLIDAQDTWSCPANATPTRTTHGGRPPCSVMTGFDGNLYNVSRVA